MSDEYIKKLSQIKRDITLIQDSIFFELHNLEKENTQLKAKLAHAERELEEEIKALDYYGDPENWQDSGDRSANFMWDITIDESDQETLGIKDGDHVLLGGKRARQRKKERKEFNEYN